MNDAIAVIRSVGERTETVCQRLLAEQLPDTEIVVIHETPFEKALRRCFDIGIESGKTWLIAVDADHVLLPGAMRALGRAAERSCAFQLQGKFRCKFSLTERDGGPRFYRVSTLHMAKKNLAPVGAELRPESSMLMRMVKQGHHIEKVPSVTSLHDHEQWYSDIYRKGAMHGAKFRSWRQTLLPQWRQLAGNDEDYRVLIAGFDSGAGGILTDASVHKPIATLALDRLGIVEKDPLPLSWSPC